jgi:hypothetical protein
MAIIIGKEMIKNVASDLVVPLQDSATPANFKSLISPADEAYYKDGDGAWTALSIADTFTEIGTSGMYGIDLTAAELNHDDIIIKVTGTGAVATMIQISTGVNITPAIPGKV